MLVNVKKRWPIDVDEVLIDDVDKLFERRGIPRSEGVSRLLDWFLHAPDVIQQTILGQMPESVQADAVKLTLERMAGDDAVAGQIGKDKPRSRAASKGPGRKGSD